MPGRRDRAKSGGAAGEGAKESCCASFEYKLYRSTKSHQRRACWGCLVLCAAPSLLATAIVSLHSQDDVAGQLAQYNTAVDVWTGMFSGAALLHETRNWVINVGQKGDLKSISLKWDDHVVDSPEVAGPETMETYASPRVAWRATARTNYATWDGTDDIYTDLQMLTGHPFPGTGNISVASADVRLAYVQSLSFAALGCFKLPGSCESACKDRKGWWDTTARVCNVYKVLTHACWVVKGAYPTALDESVPGCTTDDTGKLALYSYDIVQKQSPLPLPELLWEVRSGSDPWVVAGTLTKGTFIFADGGGQLVAWTVVLFVAAGLIFVAAAGAAFAVWRRRAARAQYRAQRGYGDLEAYGARERRRARTAKRQQKREHRRQRKATPADEGSASSGAEAVVRPSSSVASAGGESDDGTGSAPGTPTPTAGGEPSTPLLSAGGAAAGAHASYT